MTEFFRPLGEISKTVERYKTFMFGQDEPETPEYLLSNEKVEELVREGRTPIKYGTRTTNDGPEEQIYLVPPKGFNAKDIIKVEQEMDLLVFINRLGVKRYALEFALNAQQSEEVKSRIEDEMARLGK